MEKFIGGDAIYIPVFKMSGIFLKFHLAVISFQNTGRRAKWLGIVTGTSTQSGQRGVTLS